MDHCRALRQPPCINQWCPSYLEETSWTSKTHLDRTVKDDLRPANIGLDSTHCMASNTEPILLENIDSYAPVEACY